MPARGMKGTRLRRVGAGIAVSALLVTASGLGLAAAAPLGAQVGAAATTANASALVPITPTRVLNTRTSSPLGQGQTLDLKLTAPGPVPADGVGAVLNVTLDGATAKSFVTVWPAGEARPLASTNNAEPSLITPNSMTAKLGANGSVSIYNANGSTNVVIDVVGYLVPMDKVVVSGSRFWVGTTAPTTSQGKVGDTYFDSGNKALYGPAGLDPAQGSTVFGSTADGPLSGTSVLTLVTGDTISLANIGSASDFDLATPVGGTGPSLNAWILIEQLS